eukprot:GHVN01105884.1.p2 GENE.GHVN01105884.1~~GHVN01105884.1.p2  ORF type:complete len:128 (+),score=41.91 GHVN01105884.1:447-830(+)
MNSSMIRTSLPYPRRVVSPQSGEVVRVPDRYRKMITEGLLLYTKAKEVIEEVERRKTGQLHSPQGVGDAPHSSRSENEPVGEGEALLSPHSPHRSPNRRSSGMSDAGADIKDSEVDISVGKRDCCDG